MPPMATALARVLEFAGHGVEREFYVNDYGTQIDLFAASIAARMRGEEPPEDGYEGEYVVELAAELAAEGLEPDDLQALARRGVELMIARVRVTLERFRVDFDRFFFERTHARRGATAGGSSKHSAPSTSMSTRAPCGCAPPRSATTRIECFAAPRASRPTSRLTSPTTRTSAAGVTTA